MSDFVYVTASSPDRKVEMTIPVARWWDALSALASVMPADMTWVARPVENIGLRKAEVSGSSSRPREPEAVEGDRESVQPLVAAEETHSGEEHVQPADLTRSPSPPQDDDDDRLRALDLVATLPEERKAAYRAFMRKTGIAYAVNQWSDEQTAAIIAFCTRSEVVA